MVDFNNEKTISTPLSDVLKMLILECRYNLLLKIREYYVRFEKYHKSDYAEVKASVVELYYYLRSMYSSDYDEKKQKVLSDQVSTSKSFTDIMRVFELLETYMYVKNITKIDNRKQYDTTNIEIENKEKGL